MQKHINHFNNSGFSLVETMVSILIFSILTAGLYMTLRVGKKSWETNKAQIEMQQELRKATEWMKNELLEAGPTSISNVLANGISQTSINFKIPIGIVSGNINWDPNAIQFQLGGADGTDLIRSTANGTSRILAKNISVLKFTRQSSTPNTLEIAITVEINTAFKRTLNKQTQFQINLRN